MSDAAHPAPYRARISFWALMFGCCAAPIFWLGQVMLAYWITAAACYGSDRPTVTHAPGLLTGMLIALDVIAIAAALAGAFVAWRGWRITKDEAGGGRAQALHTGEGRTRFLALWGLFSSLCFAIAIVFNVIASLTVPLCTL
ncbi:MAG TPA: hypothetical protein VH000_10465 [Rhizomicrobium sp.]|jgi:hypothetical protein|nr:hypothetical protein [Rhizomicrobium sp.]